MIKERFKLVGEVYLFLIRDNKILLSRRAHTGYEDGDYSMVAGHVDGNEPIRNAMAREAFEEAGIRIDPQKLFFKLVMHRLSTDREQVGFFFEAQEWEGEPKNMESEKCDDLSWFSSNNLPANTIPYIQKAIECYKSGIAYVEFGWKN